MTSIPTGLKRSIRELEAQLAIIVKIYKTNQNLNQLHDLIILNHLFQFNLFENRQIALILISVNKLLTFTLLIKQIICLQIYIEEKDEVSGYRNFKNVYVILIIKNIKFSNINMYVNSCNSLPLSNQIYHMITWASKQASHLGYKTSIYTLNSIFQTGAFYLILRSIDSEYFDQFQPDQQYLEIQQLYRVIETYLIKQCGQRITVGFKNKILVQSLNQELLKLLLFCCLHSQKKDEYIQRVFQLDEIIQSTLMKAIEQVASNIMNIIDQNQILSRVQMLQNEAQILKSEIGVYTLKEQSSQKLIQQLDEQVKKKNKQIKAYKLQKQKVIQVLQLTNLEDYLSSFQRLQQQNKILNRYVQQLEENNYQLEQNQKQLKKQIQNQANVICDLNDDVTALKQKICSLKLQNSFRNSFDTCDASRRSFGTEIFTNDKENLISSFKDQRRSLNFDRYKQANQQKKANPKQQELIQEMAQLRKYNVDLIQKLQNAYKTLNNLNLQSSEVRGKNQILQKQNRFYKKQIGTLRKLHQKMEKDLISGLI